MSDPIPPEPQANGADALPAVEPNPGPGPGPKRQRRPSVRLGDIGEQPAAIPHESPVRRSKHWKHPATAGGGHPRLPPSSKALPVDILAFDGPLDAPGLHQAAPPSFAADDSVLVSVDDSLEPLAVAIRRRRDTKPRRSGAAAKRARSSWTSSKIDEGIQPTSVELKSRGSDDAGEKGSREFDELRAEDSESPSGRGEAALRVRVPEANEVGHNGDATEGDMPSEDNGEDWNDQNGHRGLLGDGGVRAWLSRLGLDRYAPVFEIHEVDDEVLPLLTMEDLKDMGINAVGSRRKMYCAIQKLKKDLSQESLDEEGC